MRSTAIFGVELTAQYTYTFCAFTFIYKICPVICQHISSLKLLNEFRTNLVLWSRVYTVERVSV
jgi:hypothetical protein